MKPIKYFVCVAILIIFCSACASKKESLFTVSGEERDLFADVPHANKPEVKYGYSVYLKLLSEADVVADPDIVNPIKGMGKNLAKHTHRQGFPYVFTVIKDTRYFASSTPGGFVYITDSMISYLEDDEAVAAILAHELAQTQRRRMRFTLKKRLVNFAQSVSAYAPYALGPWGVAVPKGVRLVNNYLLHESSRSDRVIEADALSVTYLAEEGYSPSSLLNVVKKIATADATLNDKLKDYMRLRPITEERVLHLKELLEESNERQ